MTKLREAREKAGLRRKYVADILGISPDQLNVIERGKQQLSITRVETLATLYSIELGDMAKIALETWKQGRSIQWQTKQLKRKRSC